MVAAKGPGVQHQIPIGPILLFTILFVLPALFPGMLGWFNTLLALPVFYVLHTAGGRRGMVIVRGGAGLALLGALLFQRLELILFSLTMIPLGYSLYRSSENGIDPAASGGRGVLVLGLSWAAFWILVGTVHDSNPYQALLGHLDAVFAQIYEQYSSNTEIPAERLFDLAQVIDGIRSLIPRILPGLLACTVVLTTWMNLAAGNGLLRRTHPDKARWPAYSQWALPDLLIWPAIAAGAMTVLGSGGLRDLGICLLMLAAMIYFFQGLAVFIHLLDRWHTPPLARIALYAILIVQTYGLLVLVLVGVADTWLDFRKLRSGGDGVEE